MSKIKKIYLSGGMHGTWQDYLIERYPHIEFFDPRSTGFTSPALYTQWDMEKIRESDAVIAYLQETNPSGVGLAYEVGYALGLGKEVYFIREKTDKYFDIVGSASTLRTFGFEAFDKMIQLLDRILEEKENK